MGQRTITVWCPDWEVIAAGYDPDVAAAVFRANRVVARTPAAAAAGVGHGNRRRVAQRVCPQLKVIDHDPHRDARHFEHVVRAVAEIAPRIHVVQPGWLQLAARGPTRYFGGESAVAAQLIETVEALEPVLVASRTHAAALGVLARSGAGVGIGIADGLAVAGLAAQLAARTPSGVLVVDEGGSSNFVAPLPIGWLARIGGADHDLVELFVRLGLVKCGDLAALDTTAVVARFGAAGLRAHQIVAATDPDLLAPTDPPTDRGVEHRFDTPIEQMDTVVFAGKRLADELAASLQAEGRVCVCLEITVVAEQGEQSQRLWYRDQGMTAAAMVERLRWQLEGWVSKRDGVSSGVVRVGLSPDEVRADSGRQAGIWGGRTQADHDAARAVTRLTGIAGDRSVTVPEWVGGRLPGERFRWVSAADVDLESAGGRLTRAGGPWPGSELKAATMVYAEPCPVTVVGANRRVVVVSGRGELSEQPLELEIGEVWYRVAAWAGPWPVEQRWWDRHRSRRIARLQLVTDRGAGYLVGREHGQWVLLASYC